MNTSDIKRLVFQGKAVKFERHIATPPTDPTRTAEYMAITMTDIRTNQSVTEFVWEGAADHYFDKLLASLEAKLREKETYP